MKITNKLNLPQSFVNYVNSDTHEFKPNRYSVTELLKPVREIILTRQHYNEITRDVSDCIPSLFGTAVHSILEKNMNDESSVEQAIECEIDRVIVAGRIDLLSDTTITDYKTTSVSKILKQDFTDWQNQGLIYAYVRFVKTGIITRKLRFIALLKDWSKIKYPNLSPVYVWEYDIQDSDYDYIEQYLRAKIQLLRSGELPLCSDSERWNTGDKYAVYKNANDKRATFVCDNEKEAHDYITNKLGGAGIINVRKGEDIKCNYYCDVCKWCKGGKDNCH